MPLSPNPVQVVGRRHQVHGSFLELLHLVKPFQVFGILRHPAGDRRKRRTNFIGNNMGATPGVHAVDYSVQHHKLPVKLVEGAQAKVPAFPKFADGDVPMIHTVQHRPDR
jgi:hypothetical protein